MYEPFIGEIQLIPFNYAPRFWAFCAGQLLQISTNQALFLILGTMYGGDGQTTFGLPNLRGRTPLHGGNLHTLGEQSGLESMTLIASNMPTHTHTAIAASTSANQSSPANNYWAKSSFTNYAPGSNQAMAAQAVGAAGGAQAHQNLSPYLALNYAIALYGLFPSTVTPGSPVQAFTGEIRMFAGNFAPFGWAFCNGTTLPTAQNTALYNVIGTTYGGDATNFALPDLRDRAALMFGQGPGLTNRNLGATGGAETVTLSTTQLPAHTHTVNGTASPGSSVDPNGNVWAVATGSRGAKMYTNNPGTSPQMQAGAFSNSGGGGAHNNMPPYLVISFIICLSGTDPNPT